MTHTTRASLLAFFCCRLSTSSFVVSAQEQILQEDAIDEDAVINVTGVGIEDDAATAETKDPLRSFPLRHCVGASCFSRGTLVLQQDGRSAKIDDAEEFIKMRDDAKLHGLLNKAESESDFYKILLTTDKNHELVTSIPVRDVRNFEDLHDNLEITLTPKKEVIAINYRIKAAWGLALFEHTAVRLNNARLAAAPVVPPKPPTRPDGTPLEPKDDSPFIMQILKRYWWAILLGFILLSVTSSPPEEGGGGDRKGK